MYDNHTILRFTSLDLSSDCCIHEQFEAQAARTPAGIALSDGAVRVTYKELDERANHVANYLLLQGAKPGARIAICIERSIEFCIGILGILKAGGAYVPLDPSYPPARLAFMLEDTAAPILLTKQRWAERLVGHGAKTIYLDADWTRIAEAPQTAPRHTTQSKDVAYVIYTSGSTGQPKGVLIAHHGLVHLSNWHRVTYQLGREDRTTLIASPGFDAAGWEIWPSLIAGACLVIPDEETRLSPRRLVAWLVEQAITVSFLPTPLAEAVLVETWPRGAALRYLLTGGDRLQRRPAGNLPFRLFNHYGPTEYTVVATFGEIAPNGDSIPSIGRPIPKTDVYVLDAAQNPLPVGVPGELYIGGIGIAYGYLNQPELTATRFVRNPFSTETNARLYRTSDVCQWRPDGGLDFLGRMDEQVKLRGFRIELSEIEHTLALHAGVRSNVVALRKTPQGTESLVAYVVPVGDASDGKLIPVLQGFLAARLPEYMVPSQFVLLDALPLTTAGKIDRRALPVPATNANEIENRVASQTKTEEQLAAIWADFLGLPKVGVEQSFFHLGGDSLRVAALLEMVRQRLGQPVSLSAFFAAPTVAGLAKCMDDIALAHEMSREPIGRADRNQPVPLTYMQQQMWIDSQLTPGCLAYNEPWTLTLSGTLDGDVVHRALQEIVRRHEILRTTFRELDGKPVQVIAADVPLPWARIDLRALPAAEREVEAVRIATRDALQPMDLERGPLFRVLLLQLEDKQHRLYFTAHHIVVDGVSIYGVIRNELLALYAAFRNNEPSPLPDLPLQFADYAVWQRQTLHENTVISQLSYWKKQLANLPTLELPTDRPRPTCRTFEGAKYHFILERNLVDAARAFGQQEGATPFMVLLAAWKTLFHRYTGQTDIVISTVVSTRVQAELESLVGCFLDTLVLRTDLSDSPTFRQLLTRTRRVCLDAYAHRDVPFELVRQAVVQSSAGRLAPLFQVAFAFEPQVHVPESAGHLSQIDIDTSTSKFDLTIEIDERPEGFIVRIEYSTALFDAPRIQRMARHLEVLLRAALVSPDESIATLPLLSEEERHQLLVEWNDTNAPFPHDATLHELFSAQATQNPTAIAVVCGKAQLTYAELDTRSNQVAHHLQSLGVVPDVLVGIFVERSLEAVIGLLGILKAGGAYVPLDPKYPVDRIAFMLEDTQAPVLLTQRGLVPRLPTCTSRVVLLDGPELAHEPTKAPHNTATAAHLAYVIYTSGSTGRPKGTLVPHRGLVNYLWYAIQSYRVHEGRGAPLHSSLSFDLSITALFAPLLVGRPVVMVPDECGTDELILHLTNPGAYSLVKVTPAHFQVLEPLMPADKLASMARVLVIGGEALRYEALTYWRDNAPGLTIVNEYGPTETVVGCCTYVVPPHAPNHGVVPIGRPIANTRLYVLDCNQQPMPMGVPGELYIAGVGVARGYLRRPELTEERFVPDRFAKEPGAKMYRTGDRVRMNADGDLEFLGRLDEQVKVRGYRIELGEIETVIAKHPAVESNAVVVREDSPGDKRLVAFVVGDKTSPALTNLRESLSAFLPEYMVPAAIVFLEQLPLTIHGKVDRASLRRMPTTKTSSAPEPLQRAPRTVIEEQLIAIWKQVLAVDEVGMEDDFFELGGDSILAIQVVAEARRLGLHLTPRHMQEHPTLTRLSEYVTPAPVRVPQEDAAGPVPLAPFQQWFFAGATASPEHYNVSVVLEVREPLELPRLRNALQALATQHDALRLRFMRNGFGTEWSQVLHDDVPEVPCEVIDREPFAATDPDAAFAMQCEAAQTQLTLESGPLLRAVYFRGGLRGNWLLLVIHHLVSDFHSIRILTQDLEAAYQRHDSPLPSLPQKASTWFAHWARLAAQMANSDSIRVELEHWLSVFGSPSPPLPVEDMHGPMLESSARTVTVSMTREETQMLLQQIPKNYGVRFLDLLVAALIEPLRDWTGFPTICVDLIGHGREELGTLDVVSSVGPFLTIFPLRLELATQEPIEKTVSRISETLKAIPRNGLGYGLLRYLADTRVAGIAQLATMPALDLAFNYHGQVVKTAEPAARFRWTSLFPGKTKCPRARRRYLLEVSGIITEGQLHVSWNYSEDRHRRATIEYLAQSYTQALRRMLTSSAPDANFQSNQAGRPSFSSFSDAVVMQKEA